MSLRWLRFKQGLLGYLLDLDVVVQVDDHVDYTLDALEGQGAVNAAHVEANQGVNQVAKAS